MTQTLSQFLNDLNADIRENAEWGDVADHIPELAEIDPAQFGIAIVLADGQVLEAGQARQSFSIQSVSKVFSLACVLERIGEQLWERVGREPSGDEFDSILLLEHEEGRPRNPFINAGALVVTDELLHGRSPEEALDEVLAFLRTAAGDEEIYVDQAVAQSEVRTSYRNAALAHYLRSFGNLNASPDNVLKTFFHQCAIAMSCVQLAHAGRIFAGIGPDRSLLSRPKQRRINALMMTCGQYDGSGDFAFRVGIPGKSGVGGGLLMIVPGQASIAIWTPGLDDRGNPLAGTMAAEKLSRFTGWSLFG